MPWRAVPAGGCCKSGELPGSTVGTDAVPKLRRLNMSPGLHSPVVSVR